MAPKAMKTIVKVTKSVAAKASAPKPTPKEKAAAKPKRAASSSKASAVVEVLEVTETKGGVDPGACSRMLSYLKYQGDADKNKKGDAGQVKAAQNALQAPCQQLHTFHTCFLWHASCILFFVC